VQEVPATQGESKISYAGVSLDIERFECMASGTRIELTPVEFRLLYGLMERPGRVFSRDQLMNLCYSDGRVVSDRTIDTHVKNLRKKLEPTLDRVLIQSIYGVGYKLD
jgi:two-component system response regulator BaeR